jgi:hypothetical protein
MKQHQHPFSATKCRRQTSPIAGRDATKRLTGRIEIDDAYLGERSGSKRGRGAFGKTPCIPAVESTEQGKPVRLTLRRVTIFCATSIAGFTKRPNCSLVSDIQAS